MNPSLSRTTTSGLSTRRTRGTVRPKLTRTAPDGATAVGPAMRMRARRVVPVGSTHSMSAHPPPRSTCGGAASAGAPVNSQRAYSTPSDDSRKVPPRSGDGVPGVVGAGDGQRVAVRSGDGQVVASGAGDGDGDVAAHTERPTGPGEDTLPGQGGVPRQGQRPTCGQGALAGDGGGALGCGEDDGGDQLPGPGQGG